MPDYSLADIAAATGNGGGNNNGGFGDGNGAWWLLVLFALLGGFGNNGRGGYGGGYGAGGVGGNEIYPWLNQAQLTNGGFRDQMIQTTLQGIQTQGQSLATQLCQCCGDMLHVKGPKSNCPRRLRLRGFPVGCDLRGFF